MRVSLVSETLERFEAGLVVDDGTWFVLRLLVAEVVTELASADELSLTVVKDHLSVVHVSVGLGLLFGLLHEIILLSGLNFLLRRLLRPPHCVGLFVAPVESLESVYLLLGHVLLPAGVPLGELALVLDVLAASAVCADDLLTQRFAATLPACRIVDRVERLVISRERGSAAPQLSFALRALVRGEALPLQLVVLDQLVGADVVDGPLVGNVFAHLVEVLLDSLVDLRKAFGSDRG